MTSNLKIYFEGNPVDKLKLDAQELSKAQEYAGKNSARKLQTLGRANLVKEARIRKASATRRVRAFSNKIWFGTRPVVLTAPRLKFVRPKRGARGLIVDNNLVKYGFARTTGRYKGIPFQRVGNRLIVLKADISQEAKTAWEETWEEADSVAGEEMEKAAGRIVRAR